MNRPSCPDDRTVALHREIAEIVTKETGMFEPLASIVATGILNGLRRMRGGDVLYVPKGDRPVSYEEIRGAFDGTNRDEVLRRFGISRATFYRAISRRSSLTDP